MAFNLQTFLTKIDHNSLDAFLAKYGDGGRVEWQEALSVIEQDVVDALGAKPWAMAALEHCDLIADNGGRDILRSVADWKRELLAIVDDIEATDQTCAVRLATSDHESFDRVVSIAYALKGLGKQSWDAFKLVQHEMVLAQTGEDEISKFREAVEHVLKTHPRQVPTFRDLYINHFRYAVPRASTHSRRPWTQVNIFAETSSEMREVLSGGALSTVKLPGLYRAAIIFDPERRTIEVVAKGGRPVRDALVDAFRLTLLPPGLQIDRLVRRKINFEIFNSRPTVDQRPADPKFVVDEIRLLPPDSEPGLITVECKREGRVVRECLCESGILVRKGQSNRPRGLEDYRCSHSLAFGWKPRRKRRSYCHCGLESADGYGATIWMRRRRRSGWLRRPIAMGRS